MVRMFHNACVSMIVLLMVFTGPISLFEGSEGSQTRAHMDVAISDITVTGLLGDRFFPGDTVTVLLFIGHDNDPLPSDTPVGPHHGMRILLTITHSMDNITNIYRDIDSLPLNYSVVRNGTYNPMQVQIEWNADFSQETDVSFTASLIITDDDTSDNGIGIGPIRFDHLRSQPFIWEDGQDVRDYESPEPHQVDVRDAVNIPFKLQNRGGEIDTFEFVVLSIPDGWNVSLGGPYTVDPSDEVEVEMFVLVSGNPFQAMADEEHDIVVDVRSIFEPNVTYNEQTVHTFRFRVNFMASAELFPEVDNVYLTPGEAHQVYYQLRNTGNGEDDYTLSVQLDDVDIRKGWKVAFESGTRQPTVKPDDHFKVILRVTVPVDAALNYVVILTITVRSMKADYNTASDPCTIFTDVRHAADIEDFDEPFDVIPGEENEILFNFTNDGNSKDPTLTLSVTYKPRRWWVVIDQTPLNQTDGIGPRTTVPMMMSVFVLETTVASSKGSMPFIVIQARGGQNENLLDEERFYFRIPLTHKVELKCDTDRIIGAPGEEVNVNFTLENRGNWLDTFDVSLDGIDLEFDTSPSVREIAPAESFRFSASFIIPWDWPADSNLSTPMPSNGTLFDPYDLKLEVRSQNETILDSSLIFHPIELFILPRYDLEMEIVDGPIWKVPYDHDQFRTFMVEVKNTGNSRCELDVFLDTSHPWIGTVGDLVPLAFNETRYLPVYLNYRAFGMDEFASPIIDMVVYIQRTDSELEYFHQDISFQFLPYTFFIQIVEVEDPRLMADGSYMVDYGENQSFRVLVVRDGELMFLPDEMDGPYVVMYIDGVERMRSEIPLMDPWNETYLDFGPMEILFKGKHDLEFVIEGVGSNSTMGVSNWSLVLYSESPEADKEGKVKRSIVPLILGLSILIVVIILIGVGIYTYFRYRPKEEEKVEEEQFGFQLRMNKN